MPSSSRKQHTLWLLAAMAAPLAHFSGGGWLTAVLTAAAVLPLALVPKRWEEMGKTAALVQTLWLGAAAGMLLRNSAFYWPSDNAQAVPLTLLVLAAATASTAAPRIGAVLALCMALTAVPVALSGAAHMEFGWLAPTVTTRQAALCLSLLLPNLPAAGGWRRGKGLLTLGVLTAVLHTLVQGTISSQVAMSVPDPFYQTARTLGHLEPVAAAGMTLGWYATAALLLESGRQISAYSGIGGKTAVLLFTAAAAGGILFLQRTERWYWPAISAVLWVLLPFLNKMKNLKKSKK